MTRIDAKFAELTAAGRKAFVSYIMAGDPDMATSLAVMKDWTPTMVATDFTWGICLTAVSATAGVWITRALT